MVSPMEKLKAQRRERSLGTTYSFKPLNFTDRSNILYDTAVYTKEKSDDIVVFLCGATVESIFFEGGENKGGDDGFIMAIHAYSGELIWGNMLGGAGDDKANAVASFQGSNDKNMAVFVTGTLAKPVSLAAVDSITRPAPLENATVEFGDERHEEVEQKYIRDAILYKFMENGTQSWNVTWGTDSDDYVSGIAVDEEHGLVYVGGSTSGTFRSEAKDSNHTKHLDDKDMFITSFQADSGSIVWTRVFGSKGFDSVQRLATDQQGNIYVTGIMSSKPFVGCWDREGNKFHCSWVDTKEKISIVALAVGQSCSKTFVYLSGYTITEKRASFLAQFDIKTLDQNWIKFYKGEKITSNGHSSFDTANHEENEMEDGSYGETQPTESNEGYGFMLMANSSGDWIDYRGLSGSESAISLKLSNNHGNDVTSCITGSLPESEDSGGIPYLFIEVDTLQPPQLVLDKGSKLFGSKSNCSATPSGHMELLLIIAVAQLWPRNYDPVENGDVEDSARFTGGETGVDSSIWVSAPRYRRLNYPSLQSDPGNEVQVFLSGTGDRGSVELTERYMMDESCDANSISSRSINNAN